MLVDWPSCGESKEPSAERRTPDRSWGGLTKEALSFHQVLSRNIASTRESTTSLPSRSRKSIREEGKRETIVSAAWDPFGSLITTHLGKGPGCEVGGPDSRVLRSSQVAKQRAKHGQVATGEEVARILRALAMVEVLPGLGGGTERNEMGPQIRLVDRRHLRASAEHLHQPRAPRARGAEHPHQPRLQQARDDRCRALGSLPGAAGASAGRRATVRSQQLAGPLVLLTRRYEAAAEVVSFHPFHFDPIADSRSGSASLGSSSPLRSLRNAAPAARIGRVIRQLRELSSCRSQRSVSSKLPLKLGLLHGPRGGRPAARPDLGWQW